MSNIPQAREILKDVINDLRGDFQFTIAEKVECALGMMQREKPVRGKRARDKMRTLTPTDKAKIKAFALANPDTHISEIAEMFGTNQGRVSEALRGH